MKYNIKIGIPISKMCYSVAFMVILSLIRGISNIEDIGVAMDANVSLLAIIFCADTYYQEIQGNRWEVFQMLAKSQRYRTICQRLLIECVFITLLVMVGYWMFYLQQPKLFSETNKLLLYEIAVFACSASALMFGTLSFTLVNVFKSLWAGIGSSVLIWIILNSTIGKKLPDMINVFAYGDSNSDTSTLIGDWIEGKIFAAIFTVLLLLINMRLLNWKRKG